MPRPEPGGKAMRRREFIAGLGVSASAPLWPRAATAQEARRVARIGFLHFSSEQDDRRDVARLFPEGMGNLGWTLGRNLTIDYRWGVNDAEKARLASAEFLTLAPDVIVSSGTPATRALKQAT